MKGGESGLVYFVVGAWGQGEGTGAQGPEAAWSEYPPGTDGRGTGFLSRLCRFGARGGEQSLKALGGCT